MTPTENPGKTIKKRLSSPKYYCDIELKPFCHNCHERHKVEVIEQVVMGSENGTTFPIDICHEHLSLRATQSEL